VRLEIEVDTSVLPLDLNEEMTIGIVSGDIEQRILRFGGYDVLVDEGGGNTITAAFNGITEEEAVLLLGRRAFLDFRQPEIDNDGRIACRSSDGTSFAAGKESIVVTKAEVAAATCSDGAVRGEVEWQPVTATNSDGEEIELTGRHVREARYHERNGEPYVLIDFTDAGALTFEQVTTRLVGYPLAFFLDDLLVDAPTVISPITNGSTALSGLSTLEARVLAAQLDVGETLVPVKIATPEN
jgi:preprotein translocase subunit SecD